MTVTVVVAIVTVIVTASLGACATIQINSAVRFAGVVAGVVPAVRTRLVEKRGAPWSLRRYLRQAT